MTVLHQFIAWLEGLRPIGEKLTWPEHLWFIIGIVVTCIGAFILFTQNTRFIRECLYPENWSGRASALMKALWISKRVPLKTMSFSLARRLVEIEILTPTRQRPPRHDFADSLQYRLAKAAWKVDRGNRSRKIHTTFMALIRQQAVDEDGQEPVSRREGSDIEFDVSKRGLDDCREAIRRYFEVLVERNRSKGLALNAPGAFLSTVKFVGGYIGPQFLVHGLLSRFKEDWKTVIDSYEGQVRASNPPYSLALVEFRASQYSCWLQWGPSIAICQCDQWHGANDDLNAILPIAYQYGFGDEDNSLDLVDITCRAQDRRQNLNGLLNGHEGHVRAGRYELVGRIRWGPNFGSGEFCRAQRAIQGDGGTGLDGRAVLELKSGQRPKDTQSSAHATGRTSRYFSAYCWAMFVITDEHGQPFFAKEEEGWRNLIPFFEHCNIADANTYLLQKSMLAVKVAEGVKRLLAADPDVAMALVCTSDQSLCNDRNGVLYQPPSSSELVSHLLRAQIASDPALAALATAGRFKLPVTSMEGDPDLLHYSSCHLPDRIEEFFRSIEKSVAHE